MYLWCQSFCCVRTIYDIIEASIIYQEPLPIQSTHYKCFTCGPIPTILLVNAKKLCWGIPETWPSLRYHYLCQCSGTISNNHADFSGTAGNNNSRKPFTHQTYHITTIQQTLWERSREVGNPLVSTVYPKKYAHGFVVLCFVVVMQSFIMNSHEVFIHIHQGCFAGTGAIVRLPQCQWSKPDGYGKISQCITTTKHSKAKTVCIFLGIYCML